MDFDHKEVSLTLGRKPQGGKISVYNDTLCDPITEYMGALAFYDSLNAHLSIADRDLARDVGQLDILIRAGVESIQIVLQRLGTYNILEREFSCNYRTLHEVVSIAIKNRLMEIQGKIKANQERVREALLKKGAYMREKFGDDSVQAWDCRQELLLFDDVELKKRAGKYREFLEKNNEKAT